MDALSTVQVPAPAGGMSDSEVIAAPVSCADRKVRWRSSFPLRGPLPLIWPRMAIPFDRHMCDRGSSATSYAPATPLPTPDPPQNACDPSENPVSQPPVSDKALDSCSSHKTIPRTRFHLSVSCCSKKCKP